MAPRPAVERLSKDFGGPIRVAVPPEVMFDIDEMQKIHREILKRLGCAGCTSGFDFRWDIIRDWAVNPQTREIAAVNAISEFRGR